VSESNIGSVWSETPESSSPRVLAALYELERDDTYEAIHNQAKIARAESSGPRPVTKDAAVCEINHDGTISTLREGKNEWVCFPGNQDEVGNVPMTCDAQGTIWIQDGLFKKPEPSNTSPGFIYMLAGAQQHSDVDAFDQTSPAIPIGPQYIILWPFSAEHLRYPTKIRDGHGANVMFNGTPYAHLHINGNPWDGTEWEPEKGTRGVWSLEYIVPKADSGR